MKPILIETHFLPSLEFFCAIKGAEEIQIEYHEHFVKQSFRNHAIINTANGIEKLTVPLTSKGNRTLIKDVKIDVGQNWRNNQWRTIQSAYRKSPYYEHYADDFNKILFKPHTFLVELNLDLLSFCFEMLQWEKNIVPTETYQAHAEDRIDLRNIILSKKPFHIREFYKPVSYQQVFGNAFFENLSMLDLIFCQGPKANSILSASCANL
jgi:WbqC-like protein family